MSPHDALARAAFADLDTVRAELRAVLPPAVTSQLDLSTLAARPETFIDERLRASQTDRLFSVTLAGSTAFVYLLFEHKSRPERFTALQLLRYTVAIWEQALAVKGARGLPVVLPLVFAHTESGWTAPRSLAELFDAPEELLPALAGLAPRFEYWVDDLSLASDDALRARGYGAFALAALFALRDGRKPEELAALFQRLDALFDELLAQPNGRRAVLMLLHYILEVGAQPPAAIRETAAHYLTGKEQIMETAGEQLRREGHLRGLQEGLQEGHKEGTRAVLLRQLTRRFGPLPPTALARVEAAKPEELERFVDDVLTATSLEELLGE